MPFTLHEKEAGLRGAGRLDLGTTRYVPISGGSRSRLPVYDDKRYSRYLGFVGIDESLTENISTISRLYTFLGGTPVILEGEGEDYVRQILEQTRAKIQANIEDAQRMEKRKAAGLA